MKNELCRYREIFPYKHNVVKISNEHEYINASWINFPYEKYFISSQGPKDFTIEDFWQMCFDYNVNVIVMLCNLKEKEKEKCAAYWEIKNPKNFKICQIKNITDNDINKDIIIKKEIVVENLKDKKIKTITHIHFTQWPDEDTPNIKNVVQIFENVFKFVEIKKEKDPVVIHCSGGVGRTGTFEALYMLYNEIMNQINNNSNEKITFNIFNLVRKLKESRHYSVQTAKQYQFIYYFIDELLKEKNN